MRIGRRAPAPLPRRPARALGRGRAAVALAARSADHLNHVSATGIAALGAAPATVAVLLPTSTLFLGSSTPDVRALLDAGAAVTIATDFNRHLAGALDARGDRNRLLALRAPTARGARGRHGECIRCARSRAGAGYAPGRPADLVVLDGDAFRLVPAGRATTRWSGRSSTARGLGDVGSGSRGP